MYNKTEFTQAIDPRKAYIGFTRGQGWVSRTIQTATKGEVSHALIVYENQIYESHFEPGVHSVTVDNWLQREGLKKQQIHLFEFEKPQIRQVQANFCIELGIKYDPFDIREHAKRSFLPIDWNTVFNHQDKTRMICTEFVDIITNYRCTNIKNYPYPGMLTPNDMFEIYCEQNKNYLLFQ